MIQHTRYKSHVTHQTRRVATKPAPHGITDYLREYKGKKPLETGARWDSTSLVKILIP